MKHDIDKALNEVTKLDSWDILSILGGVNYLCKQSAITAAVRNLPDDPPEGSGIDGFIPWEQKMKAPELKKAVMPMLRISAAVENVLNEYTDTKPTEFEDVLRFMRERPPTRERFKADYENRKRLGMKPSIPMSQFIDMEMVTAMARFEHLRARGDTAVQLLHSLDLRVPADERWDEGEQPPEWLYEAIHDKIMAKLEDRWMRAELRRTNPRISKTDRDLAEANQKLIESVIETLGGNKPDPTKGEPKEEPEEDQWLNKALNLPPKTTA